MYKIASQNRQRAIERIQLKDAAPVVEIQTKEEQRRNLVRAMKAVEARLLVEKNKLRRKELGQEKLALQDQISAIRPKATAKGAPYYFVEAAREYLTRAQFKTVMDAACDAMRRDGLGSDER